MRKLVVSAMISIDGVMQSPGGTHEDPTGGFEYGGWVFPLADEVSGGHILQLFANPFELLLGRKTYEIFAAHWPYVESGHPIGDAFNRVPKHVATGNPDFRPEWQNSSTLGADVASAVRALKAADGPTLLTQGSTELLHTLFVEDLVDELRLFVFPIVLGRGKRLFDGNAAPAAYKLEACEATPNGIAVQRYVRAGAIATGSFQLDPPTEAELKRRRELT